jgi:hypothetical protein
MNSPAGHTTVVQEMRAICTMTVTPQHALRSRMKHFNNNNNNNQSL